MAQCMEAAEHEEDLAPGAAALAALWDRYHHDRSLDLRNQLTVHYAGLAKFVAHRVAATAPAHVDTADLVSHGMLGLMDAIERFDPAIGVNFQPYALRRIRGAILDGLRGGDWAPRSVRRKARAVDEARSELGQRLRRTPTPAEVAARSALTLSEYHALRRDLARAGTSELQEMSAQASVVSAAVSATTSDPAAAVERKLLRQTMVAALQQASRRDRTVLTLYYFEGLTLAEIGEILGVGESRVCQIHAAALARLRGALHAQLDSDPWELAS